MDLAENKLSEKIIGAAIEVHRELGPGLLESVYEVALFFELNSLGLHVQRQKPIDVSYKGQKLTVGLRIDLLVEDMVIVELKTVEKILDVHLLRF